MMISPFRGKEKCNESAHDLLSDLPLSIIHCILAVIPIIDAKWRYIWPSLPHLAFLDYECVDLGSKSTDTSRECLKVVIVTLDDDQSISRKRKLDNESAHDLLSDLPLSIIHCILELIPIRDAIQTSVLSTKWRYIWPSLPHLAFFDYKCVGLGSKSTGTWTDCLKTFITKTLFLHKGPIHKFRLSAIVMKVCPDIDLWLIYLSKTEIRELFLELGDYHTLFPLHSSVYSCQKLTHLELSECELRLPPLTFNGFPFLRSLVLRCVKVPSNALETLVSKSPLIENFTYHSRTRELRISADRSQASSELRISAPKLKYFHLSGCFNGISLHAPLVADVLVRLTKIRSPAEQQLQQQNPVCNYAKFLGGCTNLERLTAKVDFTKYLSIGIKPNDHPLVFHHLKFIKLYKVVLEDMKHLTLVVHLITGSPNLRELQISTCREDAPVPMSYSDFSCLPNSTFEKLRVVKMKHVCGLQMEFVKYLLKSSPVLETMSLYCLHKLSSDVRLKLATLLLRYRRASPNAEICLIET